jgi:aminoglycoside phosphotransferase (APT) family kinase protein
MCDVVETVPEARACASPPLLILESVRAFFDEHGLGHGELRPTRIGEGGGSNFTFRIDRDDSTFVLRRPPRPPLPPSAHDMIREAHLQLAVASCGIRVPTVLAVCEDAGVTGAAFYVMEYLDGYVMSDVVPSQVATPEARRELGHDLVDTLVELHSADVSIPELATFARPGNYNERQVRRFTQLWQLNKTRDLSEIDDIAQWLAMNTPLQDSSTVVHGDFRFGNMMIGRALPPRIVAILDWEMGTVGDPRADLGYLLATYSEPGGNPSPLGLTTATMTPGFPSRDDLVDRYVRKTGRNLEPLAWFEVLALWKAAIFCEAIYGRYLRNELSKEDARAARFAAGVPDLAAAAAAIAGVPQ